MSRYKQLFFTFLLAGSLTNAYPAMAERSNAIITQTTPKLLQIEVQGNTVLSSAEIEILLAPFVGRPITLELLSKLAITITNRYQELGYTASFARVRDRQIDNGTVEIEVVEGKITTINVTEVKGSYLRKSYVRSLLENKLIGKIYNKDKVPEELTKLLQINDNIELLLADAVVERGESESVSVTLNVAATVTPAFYLRNITANTGSPSLGETNTGLQVQSRILGNGDLFVGSYFLSEGTDSFNFAYSLPVTSSNTKIITSLGLNNSNVIEEPFNFANIDTEFFSYIIGIVQPIVETPREKLSVGLTGSLQQAIGRLETEASQLFRGADLDGRLRVVALRLPLEYSRINDNNTIQVRSQFNLGLDALGATTNDFGAPDGRFFTFQTSANFNQRISPIAFISLNGSLQLANNSLNTFETFDSRARGYRSSQVSSDNGLSLNAELPVLLYGNEDRTLTLQVIPFVDFHQGWNTDFETPEINQLFSAGLGLQFNWRDRVFLRVDRAIPFLNRDRRIGERSLQDNGWHFVIVVTPFKF